ncbi:PREDICTED: nucleolar complex protein 2 homolog isoform X1 [Camelina sativa]|uniref:Nucleolar complex protein 2 homolog isoform X1 n=1 Tax=Camelina sativa TaxID=90675 RepID=A0ABM1RDA8_CAMSA|nr:PREDICTED: nucleolar complex protein 2 homolog isoform X1 [Camelina sativa]
MGAKDDIAMDRKSDKKLRKKKLKSKKAEEAEEHDDDQSVEELNVDDIETDKKSDKKRGKKKLKSKKAEEAEEHDEDQLNSVEETDVDDIETDQKSDKKRKKKVKSKKAEAEEHEEQLKRLQETQADFYEYMKEHDAGLLKFDATEVEDDADVEPDTDVEDIEKQDTDVKIPKKVNEQKTITLAMVESWCDSIREDAKLGAVRSILRAYRTACHYGDDTGDDQSTKFSVMSSAVFNEIMIFVLSEMDGILRKLLRFPEDTRGTKETVLELTNTRPWKNYNHLLKSYLGNSLHVLNQMTDTEMISFTLRRLKHSSVFLAAFPSLLRKYIKVALHFWGTGSGALPVVSLLFLRDLCIRIGSDCVDDCIKGMYKAYVLNCQFVNADKLRHIFFLGNCFIELIGTDISASYQHAFVFIRQLAMILREALNTKTKEAFRKVYQWKFIHCLELWTGAVCAYSSQSELRPVAYPLAQIITGVARLVPTARYIPLRLRCVRMLNRIAASTGTFIPVSMLLVDMLEMKELNRPPTGGVGKGVDLRTLLKVSKPAVKTRAFQEACVYSVVEELVEHLSQWSCSVAFFELSFIPTIRLRSFSKSTKAERFRKEMKQLISQIEANSEFVNKKRASIKFLPNDLAAASFLEDEKKSGKSPLLQYAEIIRQRAQQRNESLVESDVIVGENSAVFGKNAPSSDEEDDEDRIEKGAAAFNSSWLPGSDPKEKEPEEEKTKKKKRKRGGKSKSEKKQEEDGAGEDDVVEDFVLSSDEEEEDDLFDIGADKDDDEDAADEITDPETKTSNKTSKKTKGTYKTWHKTYKKTKKKKARVA